MSQLNIMRREAMRAQSTKAMPRRAIVSAYDPTKYAAKVIIQPEGVETGFLSVGCPWVGSGWGMFCPPTPGDEVDLHFQEGGKNAAYISLRFYGGQMPPQSVESGEFWLIHKSGSLVKLTNDGKVRINGNLEVDVTGPIINITATEAISITAPEVRVGGDGESLRKLVHDAMVPLFNSHTHGGIVPGGGSTAVPNEQMDGTQLTSIMSGG